MLGKAAHDDGGHAVLRRAYCRVADEDAVDPSDGEVVADGTLGDFLRRKLDRRDDVVVYYAPVREQLAGRGDDCQRHVSNAS
jgi:hypothetical protein